MEEHKRCSAEQVAEAAHGKTLPGRIVVEWGAMGATYTDTEIAALLRERKPLPTDWRSRVQLRAKRGHSERELDVTGAAGSEFRLVLRQSMLNALDFSIILAVSVPGTNQVFRLRRYNGKGHEHTNHIEGGTFYGFHVHMATERYQVLGPREDSYAEPTDRYGDFHEALRCAVADGGFDVPADPQGRLFEEVE